MGEYIVDYLGLIYNIINNHFSPDKVRDMMNIDQSAPLKAQKSIEISAPVNTVWALLADIPDWPKWQPDVTTAEIEGELAVGSIFRWKAAGLNITSTLQEVQPDQQIGWTGKSVGMQAVHHWTLESIENGTRVSTEESLNGWFARLLKFFDTHFLEKSLANSLNVLKKRAEQA